MIWMEKMKKQIFSKQLKTVDLKVFKLIMPLHLACVGWSIFIVSKNLTGKRALWDNSEHIRYNEVFPTFMEIKWPHKAYSLDKIYFIKPYKVK